MSAENRTPGAAQVEPVSCRICRHRKVSASCFSPIGKYFHFANLKQRSNVTAPRAGAFDAADMASNAYIHPAIPSIAMG
jgi:hypothetical protein